jgi:hypothetical protein
MIARPATAAYDAAVVSLRKGSPMHLIPLALVALLILPYHATAQEPRLVTADAPFTITFESIRLTHTGFMVTVSYVNTLAEPLQLTLTYPQEKSGFAADNRGNEYMLTNVSGMARRHNDPNLDITQPALPNNHSTFLLAPPHQKVMASYLFARAGEQTTIADKPASFTISLDLYARPTKDFNPLTQPQRGFAFTATVTDMKPH